MAGVIVSELNPLVSRLVLEGRTDNYIMKQVPVSKSILMEVRQKLNKAIVEVPTGIKMIEELNAMVEETRSFLDICKTEKKVYLGLQAIRTMTHVVDSFSKVYEVAHKAEEKQKGVTQQEFDTLLSILQEVVSKYPDVGQQIADRLKEEGMKEKAKNFEPNWEVDY